MKEYIYDSASKFLRKHASQALLERGQNGAFDHQVWASLHDMGLTNVNVPEAYGGVGGDLEDGFTVIKLAGQYPLPLPITETLISKWILTIYEMQVTHNEPLSFYINVEQPLEMKERNGFFTLSGELDSVPWGRVVKEVVALAKYRNQWLLVILPAQDASSVSERANLAGEPRDSLLFHESYIAESAMKILQDCQIVKKVEQLYALAKAAMLAGVSERVVHESLFYARAREQFGRSIYRFQAVQQHISLLAGETAACLAAVNHAVASFQNGDDGLAVMLTKMKVSAVAGNIAMAAHQLHGAIGMTYEHTLHHLTKRLWSWRDEGGNERYWQSKLSEYIEQSSGSLWSVLVDHDGDQFILQGGRNDG